MPPWRAALQDARFPCGDSLCEPFDRRSHASRYTFNGHILNFPRNKPKQALIVSKYVTPLMAGIISNAIRPFNGLRNQTANSSRKCNSWIDVEK
uniref:Uncharacterized protein n=1 Tax=Candidatus Kentrum eta TaxID=2126337 RepID=A0A450VU23_9GAMM|nr:MAG: hypothetical protein BECKH772B_GA0070898_104783 [Candidatus Kentron sp. H]VFK04944.1 MAG: hypothetical protein BECKH772A_GA0070896_104823 [Candidatus Kentron sp. H]VFK08267.1 MAG: hypothetical protein BECKH772C_GA0070978_104993 [Candidatus Kentron sp. H]